jgi:hypothetical protein
MHDITRPFIHSFIQLQTIIQALQSLSPRKALTIPSRRTAVTVVATKHRPSHGTCSSAPAAQLALHSTVPHRFCHGHVYLVARMMIEIDILLVAPCLAAAKGGKYIYSKETYVHTMHTYFCCFPVSCPPMLQHCRVK